MGSLSMQEREYRSNLKQMVVTGLENLEPQDPWIKDYHEWRSKEENQFDGLLEINDPFNLYCAGDRHEIDFNDTDDVTDLELYCMSVFLSEKLRQRTIQVLKDVKAAKTSQKKKKLIEQYFSLVDQIQNEELSPCIITLYKLSEKQMALHNSRNGHVIDSYASFFCLREYLRKSSVESIYFLLTNWRITKSKRTLKQLISSVVDYIQSYYEDFDHDSDMHLHYPLDGLLIIKKLQVIYHWLELIAFNTEGIFDEYENRKWLFPLDKKADHIIETNAISKYEMLLYKLFFPTDDNETIQKKATCYHGYSVWIKTVDIMHVMVDVFQVLYSLPEDEQRKLYTSKEELLDLYDSMKNISDHYTGRVFKHKVIYQYQEAQVLEAMEADADQTSKSVDDVLEFVNSIANNDIEGLLQAKQRYLITLDDYIGEEQEERLNKLIDCVVSKIKDTIQKLDVYDTLYSSISKDFKDYASVLLQYPNILCSLVSAEYLYHEYVENRIPSSKFDYSCISIMYYMSLEDFLNKLLYIPYAKEVLSKIDEQNFEDNKWKHKEALKYVSSFGTFWKKKKEWQLKTSCEIGVVGHLLSALSKETYLQRFLEDKYPDSDQQLIASFGEQLIEVAPRRNNAAHGGNYLSYEDVCTDKANVYSSVKKFRGLILELLEICLGKKA